MVIAREQKAAFLVRKYPLFSAASVLMQTLKQKADSDTVVFLLCILHFTYYI
jgi:hypothetical protein